MRVSLLLTLLLVFFLQASLCFDVGMKLLLLIPTDDTATGNLARLALDARGIPYDVVTLPTTPLFTLLDSNNNPKYCGIVFSDRFLGKTAPNRISALTTAQFAQIEDYESQYGIPEVVLNAYPSSDCFTDLANGASAVAGDFDVAQTGFGWQFGNAIQQSIPVVGAWRAPAKLTSSDVQTVVSLADLKYGGSDLGVGIALCTFNAAQNTQHRRMEFYFSLSHFDVVSHAYANMWIQFVTHGVYFGQRRIHLSTQIDDIYLASVSWSISQNQEVDDSIRVNETDWRWVVQWQDNFRQNALPVGSNFTIELWFNGAGALDWGYDNGELLACTQQSIDKFLWGTHTWDHPVLDTATYTKMNTELDKNIAFGQTYLGIDGAYSAFWQGDAIVTPSISGLGNAAVLQSLLEHGIMCAAGDTSVADLTPANPYHGLWATAYTDPQGRQVLIVPRAPTSIDYNSWNGSQVTDQYDYLYGETLTFEEILQMEADITLGFMAALDWREYMFHQSNLIRTTEGTRYGTLLTMWIESVVSAYITYFNLPLTTMGQNNLAHQYVRREDRDACFSANQINGYFIISDDRAAIEQITVQSSCATTDAFITVPKESSCIWNGFADRYGPDRTLYIPSGTTSIAMDLVWSGVLDTNGVVVTVAPTTMNPTTASVTTSTSQSSAAPTSANSETTTQSHQTTQEQQQQQTTTQQTTTQQQQHSTTKPQQQQQTTTQSTAHTQTSFSPTTLAQNSGAGVSLSFIVMAFTLIMFFI